MYVICHWDETINITLNNRCKLAQKQYKSRKDWVGNVIYRELCKKSNSIIRTNGICPIQAKKKKKRLITDAWNNISWLDSEENNIKNLENKTWKKNSQIDKSGNKLRQ